MTRSSTCDSPTTTSTVTSVVTRARRTTRAGALLLAGGVGAVLLAGCGSGPEPSASEQGADSSADSSATASPSQTPSQDTGPAAGADPGASTVPMPGAEETALVDAPACTDVWVAGRTLPAKYKGCVDGGTDVVAEVTPCESGQQIVTFGDRFWAVRGSQVKQVSSLSSDGGYRDAMTTCGA